ncbi:ABC transporter ATP-binding protein/permease [Consotaella salsifontis]|uniref:Putative ATP-binding cassette transporter n=1 Tax=Consotaella salsifontis TaxID=1365950 RepID=A0A1T4LHD7_9HYPH|nr:ABC transporter ATP-binding protein/permease [Consotaella salsifontis]SJZ53957.1 putative ATP-binding cassette transporter [Consotaella salsifontis]
MTDGTQDKTEPNGENSFILQLKMMLEAFQHSGVRNRVLVLASGLVVVILLTAYGQIRLNAWNQPFYDSLSRRDLDQFLTQLLVFGIIAGCLLVLNVSQNWLNQMTKLRLREGLTHELFEQWLLPGRAFKLSGAGEIGANPDQRIHEDARHLTELSTDLAVGLFQASMLLLSFVGVLWVLSRDVVFHVAGESFSIPGYMVWCALFYAGTASLFSYLVGRPLVRLNTARYAQEAELRFALVRLNEKIDDITLSRGEGEEKLRLNMELRNVLRIVRLVIFAQTRLNWVTTGYGWFTLIAPILVAAPGYFGGELTFGQLMMVVGAFNQVQQALRWSIDNFSTIADWRATFNRVASFRHAVVAMDVVADAQVERIEYTTLLEDKLVIDDLKVASPAGTVLLDEQHVEILPGEHVQVIGQSGFGGHYLFRALAQLWPMGSGRIGLPAGDDIAFMPRQPYIPPDTLRAILAYPSTAELFTDADFASVLGKVGLERLIATLDRRARWDRELSHEELQCVAFARMLLHRPRWIVIDQALGSFEERGSRAILDVMRQDLPRAGIINIGRSDSESFFERTLHLVRDPGGRHFSTKPAALARNKQKQKKRKTPAEAEG